MTGLPSYPMNDSGYRNSSSLSTSVEQPSVLVSQESQSDVWTLCVHPQGWIYFYSSHLKVVADQDIREHRIRGLVDKTTANYPLPDLDDEMEVQMLIQANTEEQDMPNFLLFINHKHCVASYNLQEIKDNSVSVLNPNTLNRRRRLYWNFLWTHPAHRPVPKRALSDASDALIWFSTNNLISGSRSLAPFSKTECEELSRVLRQSSETFNDGSVAKTVFLAWLLREVCSFRDSEHYGQHTQKAFLTMRQARTTPSNNSARRPTSAITHVLNLIINTLFFGIPHTYYSHVKVSSEYRGRLADVQHNWERYIERLVREYSHFLLISTVLLSATVGLLAIDEINEPARVGATISALASLGSIIVGVFCIWRHQASTRTVDSFTYMHNIQHGALGLHGHAMLLSLPPVLLVWAILSFTIAIVAYALQGITKINTIHSGSPWVIVGAFITLLVLVLIALFTFSVIWKFQRNIWQTGLWKIISVRLRIRNITSNC